MRWAEILVRASEDAEEAVTAALLDVGCHGAASFVTVPSMRGDAEVRGWLPIDDALPELLQRLSERLAAVEQAGLTPATDLSIRHVEDTNWLEEWRKYHKPLATGRRLLIVPSWHQLKGADGRAIVRLDPGMAFGTGSHPTTRLCLDLLDRLVRPGMTVADVGAGSGILAISAVMLGATHVYASECDALPRSVASENARMNGVEARITILEPGPFSDVCPRCDVVVCNIIAETIAELAPMLARILSPTGFLVASGIVGERLQPVSTALYRAGLRIVEIVSDEVWRAVLARRSA